MKARKRFGQNFLHDSNVIHKIIEAISPKSTDTIFEIGPRTRRADVDARSGYR